VRSSRSERLRVQRVGQRPARVVLACPGRAGSHRVRRLRALHAHTKMPWRVGLLPGWPRTGEDVRKALAVGSGRIVKQFQKQRHRI
jgi:hypothetical protein